MITSHHPRLVKAGQYVALLCYMIFLAIPLLWLVSISFKNSRELVALHPSFVPKHATLQNYSDALRDADLVHSGLNSLKVSVITAILTTLVGLPAAYVLARTRGFVSKLGLGYILVSQMFPSILIIIPLFLVLRDLHLTNSHSGLILVYLVWSLPFILWMLQSYIRNIPRDLEEAAAVDGARRIQIVIRVIAPLLAPGVVVTLLFAFISAWNEFFFALVLLQSPGLVTLPVKLAQFVGIEGQIRLGPLAAASLLATLPSLLFFSVMQRWLTSGLLSGAVKG
ncbi:MAG: carbohydrate ABC transporter permease [Gaiellaceae bacterium]